MIYFSLEIKTKWRNHDHENMYIYRENFLDVVYFMATLFFLPYKIEEIKLKQYAYNSQRTTLLNCFKVVYPGNDFFNEPIFVYEDVSFCV